LTETSISQLFLAGFLPGILTVAGFMLTIAIMTRIDPRLGPPGGRTGLRDRIVALRSVWGAAALFLLVIGGLYIGVFSPTEAASIGAVGALALGILNRSLTYRLVARSLLDTVKTTAMIFTILIGAILFNNFLILASMPTLVSGWITGLPLGKTAILLVILGMYFILGCLLDSLAMILLTIPIVFPIVQALGYDPVWFGIIIVMVVELKWRQRLSHRVGTGRKTRQIARGRLAALSQFGSVPTAQAGVPVGPPTGNQRSPHPRYVCMLARSIPGEPLRWTLPETTYLSSGGFGGGRLPTQRGSRGSQANENPRQCRNRSATSRSVNPSAKDRCLGS